MQLTSITTPARTNEQLALRDAGELLRKAADHLATPDVGRTEFAEALKDSTFASGLLDSYGEHGDSSAVLAGKQASAEIITMTFSAIATVAGAPERFSHPGQPRIDAAVAAAREAAELLRRD